ncbi:hypothetical protein CPB86DRAFT_239420 [Serendipita vermifera]|nr:hypothetical protein CPB86DRAFT_239420 [Serendipita vermifera]
MILPFCSLVRESTFYELTVHLGPKDVQNTFSFTPTSRMVDGWILGPNLELLFWVPPELRPGLMRPSNVTIIGKFRKTGLDFANSVQGESWKLCRDEDPPRIIDTVPSSQHDVDSHSAPLKSLDTVSINPSRITILGICMLFAGLVFVLLICTQ